MLLQNRELRKVLIPLSSKCYIINRGVIKDGDIISVMSPIFASIKFASKATSIDNSFNVIFHTNKSEGITITDDNYEAFLNCEDQDLEHMYVTMEIGK